MDQTAARPVIRRGWVIFCCAVALVLLFALGALGPARRWYEVRRGFETEQQLASHVERAIDRGDAGALAAKAIPRSRGARDGAERLLAACGDDPDAEVTLGERMGRDLGAQLRCAGSAEPIRVLFAEVSGGGMHRWFIVLGVGKGEDLAA